MEKYLSIRVNTALYMSIFFLSLHYVFVYLTNSSILRYHFNFKTSEVLVIYGIASLFGLSVYLLMLREGWIDKTKRNIYIATAIEILILVSMFYFSAYTNIYAFIVLFTIHNLITPYILFNLDVLFEAYTNIKDRGKSRGIYLTVWNTPFIVVPIVMSTLTMDNLNIVYIISAILLIPFFFLIHTYIKTPQINDIPPVHVIDALKKFFQDKLDRNSFLIQLALSAYYGAIGVILPIYLHSVFNFDWDKIGLILSVMVAPFILIQIPFGNIEDKKHNEKSIMHLGAITAIVFTIFLALISPEYDPNISFLLFIVFLFVANIGLSLVEISMDSMFYKHVTSRDNSALLIIRSARIIPYILGIIFILISF